MNDCTGQLIFEGDVLHSRLAPWSKVRVMGIHDERVTLQWVSAADASQFQLDADVLASSNWVVAASAVKIHDEPPSVG